jgi:hypothetical protein
LVAEARQRHPDGGGSTRHHPTPALRNLVVWTTPFGMP